jgi:cell division protein FtsQ
MRRDLIEDFADDPYEDEDAPIGRRKTGVRVRFRGLPATRWGRIFAGCGLLLFLGMGVAVFSMVRTYLLHDERFVIPSSSSIEFDGNAHVTRAQLLGVFGGDVERNIFTVSLEQRRSELERLPWVGRATVMRLLPNRMRVSIVERTPVAFVRQGGHIGLVDGNGVLLDMPVDAKTGEHYSFPVVTGILANDPLSTRSARMKIFARFTADLDGSGEKISEELSEVDLSNPEDVQALIPDHSTEILVHFGEDSFLDRYRRFKEHLAEWRTLYPKLSSVDMRYDRQVILQMPPGSSAPAMASSSAVPVDGNAATPHSATGDVAKPALKANIAKPSAKASGVVAKHGAASKPARETAPAHVVAQSEVAFDAAKKSANTKAKKPTPAVKRHPIVVRHPANATPYHPTQAVHP